MDTKIKRAMQQKKAMSAPLGQGGRFAALKDKLSHEKGVEDPAALAASIGRKAHGSAEMAQLAAKGK